MFRFIAIAASIAAFAALPLAAPAATNGELVYADGQTYTMIGATLVTNASPGMLNAPPIYILGYRTAPGTTGSITLPSGYQPQCNPCAQEPMAYHDHVLTGEPGAGTAGTAGDYLAPWRVVIMRYTPGYANSADFHPVTSDTELAAAEAAGEFLPINPAGPNPYEIWTDNVLICPLVRAG